MSEKAFLKRIRELEKLLEKERKGLEKLRKIKKIKPRKIIIPRKTLRKLVKENKSNKQIAKTLGVSERTVARRVKEYKLKGLRPKGRKRIVIFKWIPLSEYMSELNKRYRFQRITYPPFQYINVETLVCSNQKANPKGKFSLVGLYFIVLYDKTRLIFYHAFFYRAKPVSFKEIYAWAKENAFDMLLTMFARAKFTVEKIIAYTFLKPTKIKQKNEGKKHG